MLDELINMMTQSVYRIDSPDLMESYNMALSDILDGIWLWAMFTKHVC